jgi:hypothetical protein
VAPAGAGFAGANGKIACPSNRTGNFETFLFDSTGTEVNPTNLTNECRPKESISSPVVPDSFSAEPVDRIDPGAGADRCAC